MMDYKVRKKFIDKLTSRLTNYYRDNYGLDAKIQDDHGSWRFSYNGVTLNNALRIYFTGVNKASINLGQKGFNIPVDELRIRYNYYVLDDSNYMYMVVYFQYKDRTSEFYSYEEDNKEKILDLISKYYKVDESRADPDTMDVYISGYPNFSYDVDTTQGKILTAIIAGRRKGEEGFLHIPFRVDYSFSKWTNFLRSNAVKITTDESTWDDSIAKIIDVIDTLNNLVSKFIKETTLQTLNLFLNDLREQIEKSKI